MKADDKNIYDKEISKRLALIIKYTNLEILGFAKLIGLSRDIIYSILTERRKLSNNVAKIIGVSLNFDGTIIFNLNLPIPETIKSAETLAIFKKANENNLNYFITEWNDKKISTIIKTKLVDTDFFEEEKYTWEVTDELKKYVKDLKPDLINKQLKYLTQINIIKSKKAPIKLRSNLYGERIVDVFWR